MNVNKSWNNPVGIWKVETEADCEGRSRKTLGIFNGHYCHIALGLADKCCYTLHFTRIDPSEMIAPNTRNRDEVDVSFSDNSIFRAADIVEEVRKIANLHGIAVSKGRYAGHVTLHKEMTADEMKASALAKVQKLLTPEELESLGLA